MKNFDQKVKTIGEIKEGLYLIAAGPITKQPATRGYRFILVKQDHGFLIYREQFNDFPSMEGTLSPTEYFKMHEFPKACEKFAELLGNDSRNYHSLYRDSQES